MLYNLLLLEAEQNVFQRNWESIKNTWNYLMSTVEEIWAVLTEGFAGFLYMFNIIRNIFSFSGASTALQNSMPYFLRGSFSFIILFCLLRLIITLGGSSGN